MRRKAFIGAMTGLALAVASAAPAEANVYCVAEPACEAVEGTTVESGTGAGLQDALTAAESHAGSTVEIGAGRFEREGGFAYSGPRVEIRGAGGGRTVLGAWGMDFTDTLALDAEAAAAPTLSDLTVRSPEGYEQTGLRLSQGVVQNVSIEGEGTGVGFGTGLAISGGAFVNGSIAMGVHGTSVAADEYGSGGEIADSVLEGSYALLGSGEGLVRRSRLYSRGTVAEFENGRITIEDSLLDLLGGPGPGLRLVASLGGELHATLRSLTIVNGGSDSTGIAVRAERPSPTASIDVLSQDSVISGIATPIAQIAESAGSSAVTTAEYSDFDAAADGNEGGGTSTIEDLAPVAGEADFVAPVTGAEGYEAADWRLAPGSPLIDAGRPGGLAAGESETDLAGQPRVVHGRRDVGAYEYQWRGPEVSATATPSPARVGEVIVFEGAGSPLEPGDSIAGYQWTFDEGPNPPPGAEALHLFLKPGVHEATLTAADVLGVKGTTTLRVDVSTPVCDCAEKGEPRLSSLSVSPPAFHALSRGGPFASDHKGALVRFALNVPALVRFTVEQRLEGERAGSRCWRKRVRGHGRGCVLYVSRGSFTRMSREGPNAFRFSGRMPGGHALPAGVYLLAAAVGEPRVVTARADFAIRP